MDNVILLADKNSNSWDFAMKIQSYLVSPDAGGVDRARAFAQKLESEHPIAFIEKRRPSPGEVAEMKLAGDVQDKDVLINSFIP